MKIKEIEIEKIKTDKTNPNKMTEQQLEALKKNIKKYGFIVPIIVNKKYVIADGEHRYRAAVSLKMKKVLTIVLDVNEVDRRIIRQVMNKLKGQHVISKDIAEFEKMFKDGFEVKDLAELLGETDKYFKDILELKKVEIEEYLVVREVDENISAVTIPGNKQIKLKLTKEQKNLLDNKFKKGKKIFEIVDYFLVPG